MMLGGLGAAGLGLLLLLIAVFGGFGKKPDSVESRIEAYTQRGRRRGAAAAPVQQQGVAAQAVGIATKALEGNRGLESALGDRLEAAGMSLKPAEWLLLHAGIAVGAAAVGFLMSSGGLLITIVALFAGILLPWLYLGFKRSSRLKAFNSQLRRRCSCWPEACRLACRSPRASTRSCARARTRSRASSVEHWSRLGSACRSRTPSRRWHAWRARTSSGR